MRSKVRAWQRDQDDDPTSGLVNLFDVWIVVVVALILALLNSASQLASLRSESEETGAMTASDTIDSATNKLPRFKKSDSTLSGQGEMLGTAYRLQNGEIVYVPATKTK